MNEHTREEINTVKTIQRFFALQSSKHISFDKHQQSGTSYLKSLFHAIEKRLLVKFIFDYPWRQEGKEILVRPYALKQVKNTWFLVGKHRFIRSFPLELISNLNVTAVKFKYPSRFNVGDFYKYSIGSIGRNKHKIYDVILSFNSISRNYILAFPIHCSQKVLVDNLEEFRIRLNVSIDYNLIQQLVSYSWQVKVINQVKLINKIKQHHQEALDQYIH